MVQVWSGEGKVRRGVSARAERREVWQGAVGVKKYKSGNKMVLHKKRFLVV